MIFRDAKLQARCERAAGKLVDYPPDHLPVAGLFDAWYWFYVTEGQDSPRAAEAVEHLLSPELRPALREWFKRWSEDMNENALQLRDRLGELAGERFG